MQRVGWDLRGPAPLLAPPRASDSEDEFSPPPSGAPVPSGTYTIRMAVRVDGVTRELGAPRTIAVKGDGAELTEFRRRLEDLQRAVAATAENANSARQKLTAIKRALDQSTAPASLRDRAASLDRRLDDILLALSGDRTLQQRQENQPPSISERVGQINGELRTTTSQPTATHRASFEHASAALARELPKLKTLIESDLRKLEADLEAARVPPTPGRLPDWKK
jgi:chromosome segregation ATPase